jgi:hypothetical protein
LIILFSSGKRQLRLSGLMDLIWKGNINKIIF